MSIIRPDSGQFIILIGLLALFRSWYLNNYFREFDGKKNIGFWKSWIEIAGMKPKSMISVYLYIIPLRKSINETESQIRKRKKVNLFTVLVYVSVIGLLLA